MGNDGGPLTNYVPFVRSVGNVRSANEEPVSWLMSARTDTELNSLMNNIDDPMGIPPVVSNLKRFVTNSIPDDQAIGTSGNVCSSTLIGNFAQCAFGIRQTALMEVTNTGGDGTFEQVQTLIRMTLRADFHALRPAAFCKVVGITPTV
jgi:hypothetical protein